MIILSSEPCRPLLLVYVFFSRKLSSYICKIELLQCLGKKICSVWSHVISNSVSLRFSGGLCEAELHACISLLNIRILVAHYCAVDTLKEPAEVQN